MGNTEVIPLSLCESQYVILFVVVFLLYALTLAAVSYILVLDKQEKTATTRYLLKLIGINHNA